MPAKVFDSSSNFVRVILFYGKLCRFYERNIVMLVSNRLPALVLAFSFSGCASLHNPYVSVDSTACSAAGSIASMTSAVTCVDNIKSKYLDAMGEQAKWDANTGLLMIPVGAYAASMGLSGGHVAKLRDFTIGGAALLGMSNWLSQPSRSQIYAVGMQALQCAVDVMSDFEAGSLSVKGKAPIEELDEALVVLANAINNTDASEAETNDASSVYNNGSMIYMQHKKAPIMLRNAGLRINDLVNLSLSTSTPSLASLPAILEQLKSIYQQSGQAQSTAKPAEPSNDQKAKNVILRDSSGRRYDVVELRNFKANVANLTARLTPSLPISSLAACGITKDEVIKTLRSEPAAMELPAGDINPRVVVIHGGSGKYAVSTDSTKLLLKQDSAWGGTLTVSRQNGAEAAKGIVPITVTDSAGTKMVVMITLLAVGNQ